MDHQWTTKTKQERDDGKRKQRASKQPSFVEAKRLLIEIEARIARGMVGIEERRQTQTLTLTLTLGELFDRFLIEYQAPTIKNLVRYRYSARICLRRVGLQAPKIVQLTQSSVDSNHMTKVRDALMARYPAGTVRTTLISVSAALSWAVREKLIDKNPVKGVQRPPSPAPRLDFLTANEVRRLLYEAERRTRSIGRLSGLRRIPKRSSGQCFNAPATACRALLRSVRYLM